MYSLKRLVGRAIKLVRPLWTMLNDAALNIHTMSPRTAAGTPSDPAMPTWRGPFSRLARHADNLSYASPDYWYLGGLAKRLKLSREDVFYDIGCGMGRMLCVVARQRIRKCVGIELLEPLCEEAKRNALRLRAEVSHRDYLR